MRSSRRRGTFSILEIQMAVLIVLIGTVYVMSLLTAGGRPQVKAQDRSVTGFLARSKMDAMMGAAFTNVVNSSGAFPTPYHDYKYEVTVAPWAGDLKTVVVQVTSPGGTVDTLSALRAPDVDDAELGKKKFFEYGCNTCHAVSGLVGPNGQTATGTAGPPHTHMASVASSRVSGLSAEDYVTQSVRDPSAYVVSGYSPTMSAYPNLEGMPDEDLKAITAFLMTLK